MLVNILTASSYFSHDESDKVITADYSLQVMN